jgi:glyoxylase-like metal-dependent hydrolase (beta-lactamase superfamily II)
MSSPSFRVISIGTLAAHPLWDEKAEVRTGHATTTLIDTGEHRVLVDPGLPPRALEARLSERSRIRPADITHVFISAFTIDHYRGLSLFERARWVVHEPELHAARAAFNEQLDRAEESGDAELTQTVRGHMNLLERCHVPEDHLVPGVDLFPLPGVTPGNCGLLLPMPASTVVITGDAIPTLEHLEQGKVLPSSADVNQAQESFREAIEIADLLVLGRDNLTPNPLRQMM